jgi:hypothetical protein
MGIRIESMEVMRRRYVWTDGMASPFPAIRRLAASGQACPIVRRLTMRVPLS